LLEGGIEGTPEASLDRLCKLALEAQIYRECVRYYPFVLGAQPVRPVDLAAFYAAIANEGLRPAPHVIDSIERDGVTIYRHDPESSVKISSVDHVAFYQLKTLMQGVLARGTARAIAGLAPYVAGKTGTSDMENDAWFVGFTNDVTVAVWIGYDNADGKRRTLGGGSTGGGVAVPIFEPVMQAVWTNIAVKTTLAPPSPEAKPRLSCKMTAFESGDEVERSGRSGVTECFRVDARGRVINTRNALMSRGKDQNDDERPRRRARSRDGDERARTASQQYWHYPSQWGWRNDYSQHWQGGWRNNAGGQWQLGWGNRW
jgi:penicillin-binding protein 1A